jgi:hypothetical protein
MLRLVFAFSFGCSTDPEFIGRDVPMNDWFARSDLIAWLLCAFLLYAFRGVPALVARALAKRAADRSLDRHGKSARRKFHRGG